MLCIDISNGRSSYVGPHLLVLLNRRIKDFDSAMLLFFCTYTHLLPLNIHDSIHSQSQDNGPHDLLVILRLYTM